MSNMKLTAAPASEGSSFFANLRHKMPKDTGIFVVMLVIALTFEIAGWYVRDQSFLLNTNRLVLIVLQVAIIGIIAVGVTQVIITTGIDLSSGSVIALAAVVAASLTLPRLVVATSMASVLRSTRCAHCSTCTDTDSIYI